MKNDNCDPQFSRYEPYFLSLKAIALLFLEQVFSRICKFIQIRDTGNFALNFAIYFSNKNIEQKFV